MSFKHKFVVNPQHDSEGFTDYAAKCRGCAPDEACPRSGHCERYDSPLHALMLDQRAKGDALRLHESIAAQLGIELPLSHSNPKGWREPGMQPITWAELSDEQLEAAFQEWYARHPASLDDIARRRELMYLAHQRISDINKLRKLRFGQATMLGVTFRQRDDSGSQWEFMLPDHLKAAVTGGYVSGYYTKRWEAVDKALKVLGVIE